MITDIRFDPIARDIIMDGNDFALTDTTTASTQNGAIILESRCGNLTQPIIGIGFNSQVQGGDVANATFELNRCVAQIQADGGSANWKSIPPPPNIQFDFSLNVNYPG